MMKVRKLILPIRTYSTKRDKFVYKEKISKNAEFKSNKIDQNPGISNRLKMYQDDEIAAEISASHGFEELHEDMDEFESDFMNAGKSHRMHERERAIQNEKLKNKITFSKYLKEVEPSFLTFAEKEEIKSLHERDPLEWSVEKLSQSFPALPGTIKKVLHAKWSPKSVETVLRYDEKVISNWEAFRRGELPLSPAMENHLLNFKDRQIVQTGREELAKRFVPEKMEFPKPKSKIFSSIVKKFLATNLEKKLHTDDENIHVEVIKNVKVKDKDFEAKEDCQEKITRVKSNRDFDVKNFQFKSINNRVKRNVDSETSTNLDCNNRNFEENKNTKVRSLTIQERYQNTEVVSSRKENQMSVLSQNLNENDPRENKKRLTFDEFLIKNVGRTKDSSSPEDIVLKETYKRHVERMAFERKPTFSTTESETEERGINSESEVSSIERNLSSVSLKEEEKGSKSRISTSRTRNEVSNFNKDTRADLISKKENNELSVSIDRSGLDTYVKEWIKKGDDIHDDPAFIKIPKHRYKAGMTYRVRNCYYDDDGEFLYKVPGLNN